MPKVALFGTFDVDNYGDLLFPYIAEYRLPNYEWEYVSPTRYSTIFKDSKTVIPFNIAKKQKYDAVLIGGGNILHLLDNKKTVYKKESGFAYADLWIGAAKIAMKQDIPYIFNAPGVSKNITSQLLQKIALSSFKFSNYVSFRERLSVEIISSISSLDSTVNAIVVPDTAFDIARMWPLKKTEKGNYIAINLNDRYHQPIEATARSIDQLSKKVNLPVKFVVIGDCHGDSKFTNMIASHLNAEYEITSSDNLEAMAQIIGNSVYFLGSSMHGFITALSYGVPAFLVLNHKPIHKFHGLLSLTEINDKCLCTSFGEALENFDTPGILTAKKKAEIQNSLNKHWGKVKSIVENEKSNGKSFWVLNYEWLLKLQNKIGTNNRIKGKLPKFHFRKALLRFKRILINKNY